MCSRVYSSPYGTVDYREEDSIVLLTWKKKCSGSDYRNTALSALDALRKYENSNLVIDARNGFEDEPQDVEWGFQTLLPEMAKTSCKCVVFILETVNSLEQEMDLWTKEFLKYFKVKQAVSYPQAAGLLKDI